MIFNKGKGEARKEEVEEYVKNKDEEKEYDHKQEEEIINMD
jgi:hypothetical protein